ncbi:MAG: hypothetical protein RBS08_07200 [Bdellovibrionales bacterium]|nr:hypothetical protein [Bdellovibrionales bacterium]
MTTDTKFPTALILTALMIFTPALCHADAAEIIHIAKEAEEKTVSDYAGQQGWCDQPPPKAKEGEIVISWTKDENGKCLRQNISVEE